LLSYPRPYPVEGIQVVSHESGERVDLFPPLTHRPHHYSTLGEDGDVVPCRFVVQRKHPRQLMCVEGFSSAKLLDYSPSVCAAPRGCNQVPEHLVHRQGPADGFSAYCRSNKTLPGCAAKMSTLPPSVQPQRIAQRKTRPRAEPPRTGSGTDLTCRRQPTSARRLSTSRTLFTRTPTRSRTM